MPSTTRPKQRFRYFLSRNILRHYFRSTIHQALTVRSHDGGNHALAVADCAVTPPERKFVTVPMKMALAELMKNPVVTALHQGEERFCRVRVDHDPIGTNAGILLPRMIHSLMRREHLTGWQIAA